MSSRTGFVLSDLHLFAGRSDGHALFDSVRSQISESDVLVLNGDTFDFRWSRFSTEKESISEAIRWLENLISGFRSDQKIYFLHGNHDCLAEFSENLDEFAATENRLIVEKRKLTLGNHLFLHGDGANWKMDHTGLEKFRDQWSRDKPKGKLAATAYDTIDAIGMSKIFHRLYFPTQKTIERITFHLDQVKPSWRDEINTVYFGHTHCPFENVEHDGIRFFNTGSGIRGMGFAPQRFEFEAN